MIRRHGTGLRSLLVAADAAVAVGLVVLLFALRYGTSTAPLPPYVTDLRYVLPLVVLYAAIWVGLLFLVGEYRLRARWTLRSEAAGIARATVGLALISFSVLFLIDFTDVSRLYLMLLFPLQGLATVATRGLLRWAFVQLRRRGRNNRYVVVLGTGPMAYEFARRIEEQTAFGLRVVGFLGDPPVAAQGSWPYLGPISDIVRVFHQQVVDEAAICLPRADWATVEEVIQLCQEEGKIVRIPLETPQIESNLRFVEDLDGVAVLSLVQSPDRAVSLALKRLVDMLGAAAALVVLSPFIIGTALYIAVRDGRPILFRQPRVGVHGRIFTILKFRTMVKDAEERFPEVAHLSATRGAAFKLGSDPRITAWGHALRRTSIDELPQLWNVLRGDMSLVGPRPAPPREVDRYDVWHRRRLSMKPGMTGLWQISSRFDADFDERARLDLDYIDRWSLWLDLRIVAKTFPAVLHVDGR